MRIFLAFLMFWLVAILGSLLIISFDKKKTIKIVKQRNHREVPQPKIAQRHLATVTKKSDIREFTKEIAATTEESEISQSKTSSTDFISVTSSDQTADEDQ
ncbi:hypothetical protein PoB_003532900 [Plakobranchus ocellatus]|uniref:Uncharacterized protein n=1 Tax=Plakobranchus ocellatus TaxID=259542 RepID=A0AAV4AM44_9GAST|nr:hypothetical protein PoB_003532900 [Plakobranchus ocellatus]